MTEPLTVASVWGKAVSSVAELWNKVAPNWLQKQTEKNNEIRNENYKVGENDVDAAGKRYADKLHDGTEKP